MESLISKHWRCKDSFSRYFQDHIENIISVVIAVFREELQFEMTYFVIPDIQWTSQAFICGSIRSSEVSP